MRSQTLVFTSLIVAVSACGKISDAPNGKYSKLPELEQLQKIASEETLKDAEFLGVDAAPTACRYWEALAKRPSPALDFRLYRAIYRNPETGELSAVQAAGENPQVLYSMSRETNPDGSPLSPPTIDEFIALARQKQKAGETSWGKVKLLEILNVFGRDKKLIAVRNQIVTESIEKKIPGGVGGNPTALLGSGLFDEVQKSIPELMSITAQESKSLAILTRKTPLFDSSSAESRGKDMNLAIAILSRSEEKASLDEKLCRFALSQRLTSQLLSLKGFSGAPDVNDTGLLLKTPDQDSWEYPVITWGGNFGKAMTPKEIEQKLMRGDSVRGKASKSTAALIASLRSSLRLMGSHRNTSLWTGKSALNSNLLKLGFAFFALEMPVLVSEDLKLRAKNRMSLEDDSLGNLLELGELALDGLYVAEQLQSPNKLAKTLLAKEQIEALAGASKDSMKSRLGTLLTGVLLEIRLRTEVDSKLEKLSGAELKALAGFYRRAGIQVGNSLLKRRHDEIRALAR
jgi:hypothetical protein